MVVDIDLPDTLPTPEKNEPVPSCSSGCGRPKKLFAEISDRRKRIRIQPLIKTHSQQELLYAAEYSLQKSDKRDAAVILKEMTETTPKRVTRVKKVFKSPVTVPIPYTKRSAGSSC